jgi:hypothetical protein
LRKQQQEQRNKEELDKERERQLKLAEEYERKTLEVMRLQREKEAESKEPNAADLYKIEKLEEQLRLRMMSLNMTVNQSAQDDLKGLDAEIHEKVSDTISFFIKH